MSQGKVNGILNYLADNAPIVLTQEQYDSLSTSEKEGGKVYYVNDGRSGAEVVNLISSSPAGVVQAYAGSSAPAGWLICDGSAVSRSVYSQLFSAIGTTYGSGNGSTTFNLPDLSFSSADILSKMFKVVSKSTSISIGAYGSATASLDFTTLGYKPVGIIRLQNSSGSNININGHWWENDVLKIYNMNTSGTSISSLTVIADIVLADERLFTSIPTNTKYIISTGKNMLTGMIEDIKDVQVDGTTVCSNGVANIDIDDSIFSSATRSKWEDILDI